MKQRRSTHQTQWAAQFAAASELCRRGYQVALTLGNHPLVDIMVLGPKRTPFLVDVKGQYKKNFWPVRPREHGEVPLFYILVFIPAPDEGAPEYYILRADEMERKIQESKARWVARNPEERDGKADPMPGVDPKYIQEHRSCWKKLPDGDDWAAIEFPPDKESLARDDRDTMKQIRALTVRVSNIDNPTDDDWEKLRSG